MNAKSELTTAIMDGHVLGAGKDIEQITAEARKVVDRDGICLVRGFPVEPNAYLSFLGYFGEPLANYSSKSELAKTDPHPQINRVKYKKTQGAAQSVHYVSGGLRPHSARSWCDPRPSFFAMLMADPGWRDAPPGERGESVVLRWEYLFGALAERDGVVFQEHFDRLSGTPVTFQANNVREELSNLPLCYQLADSRGQYDLGVRLKQDIGEKIYQYQEQIPNFGDYCKSLNYLLEASADDAFLACFPMERGDLILMDNHRIAHGRKPIVGEYVVDGEARVNNRELWSVTVR